MCFFFVLFHLNFSRISIHLKSKSICIYIFVLLFVVFYIITSPLPCCVTFIKFYLNVIFIVKRKAKDKNGLYLSHFSLFYCYACRFLTMVWMIEKRGSWIVRHLRSVHRCRHPIFVPLLASNRQSHPKHYPI